MLSDNAAGSGASAPALLLLLCRRNSVLMASMVRTFSAACTLLPEALACLKCRQPSCQQHLTQQRPAAATCNSLHFHAVSALQII